MDKEQSTKEQLEELYASINTLKKYGMNIPDDILQQVSDKEKEYIDNEVCPALLKKAEDVLAPVRNDIQFVIDYKDGKVTIHRANAESSNSTTIPNVYRVVAKEPRNSSSVTLNRKHEIIIPSSRLNSIAGNGQRHQNYNMYSLNGGEFLNKTNFVLALVSTILDYDPQCEYKELKELLPIRSSNNRTLITFSEWREKSEDAQKRYALNKPFKTVDGTEFYVSTQWTKETFDKSILPTVENLGFTWEVMEN